MECEQYKVVGELIKLGADTSHLSFTPGDTPIHAVMTMILEKDKGKPSLGPFRKIWFLGS